MSVSSSYRVTSPVDGSLSLTKPTDTPATGARIGTPASIIASEAAQAVAMDEEPLDDVTSLATLTVYGNVP